MDEFLKHCPDPEVALFIRMFRCRAFLETCVENLPADTFKTIDSTCLICQDGQDTEESADTVVKLKSCGHYFHMMCIVKWLADDASSKTCPTCRSELYGGPEMEKEFEEVFTVRIPALLGLTDEVDDDDDDDDDDNEEEDKGGDEEKLEDEDYMIEDGRNAEFGSAL
ncbi:hypothetical protein ACN47E_000172 [Coniothyrium glycines]